MRNITVNSTQKRLNLNKVSKPKWRRRSQIDQRFKIKVQTQIQGEQVRVTGKSRDDLQAVIQLVKGAELGQPFQFNNFRD
ncbi:putative nucleotide-binding protein [Actinobacillus equuli]|nr:putative nucleotide-binding protein [Actinobacillus equuli]